MCIKTIIDVISLNTQGAGSIPDEVIRFVQLTKSFQPHYGPGFGSASNRNDYHESSCGLNGRRSVMLTTSPHSVSLDVSQSYGPPWSVRGIALSLPTTYTTQPQRWLRHKCHRNNIFCITANVDIKVYIYYTDTSPHVSFYFVNRPISLSSSFCA
jgi:hypothetical protein